MSRRMMTDAGGAVGAVRDGGDASGVEKMTPELKKLKVAEGDARAAFTAEFRRVFPKGMRVSWTSHRGYGQVGVVIENLGDEVKALNEYTERLVTVHWYQNLKPCPLPPRPEQSGGGTGDG